MPKKSTTAGKISPEAEALFAIADALREVAHELKYLGNGNASTQMGAIEGLGMVFKQSIEEAASQLSSALIARTMDSES